MLLNPYEGYRYSLKRGMTGTDVAGLQINFPDLTPDGWFGKKTKTAVTNFQLKHEIGSDGIVGPQTNAKIVEVRSRNANQNYDLPQGLLKSISNKESGQCPYATAKHPSGSGIDVGAFQMSSGHEQGSQDFYHYAYNVSKTSLDVAINRVNWHNKITNFGTPKPSQYFNDLANGNVDKFRWQLSVLAHNWPDAAEDIPRYGVIYEFEEGRDDAPAEWIRFATNGRLETPREWVADYIQDSTVYINWQ